MIETVALAGTVVGYLVKYLKDNKDFQKFTSDFTSATINWVKPIFLTDENNPTQLLQDLKDKPDEAIFQESAKIEIAKIVTKNPEILPLLKALSDEIMSRDKDSSIIKNTTQIHYGIGDIIGRDKNIKN